MMPAPAAALRAVFRPSLTSRRRAAQGQRTLGNKHFLPCALAPWVTGPRPEGRALDIGPALPFPALPGPRPALPGPMSALPCPGQLARPCVPFQGRALPCPGITRPACPGQLAHEDIACAHLTHTRVRAAHAGAQGGRGWSPLHSGAEKSDSCSTTTLGCKNFGYPPR